MSATKCIACKGLKWRYVRIDMGMISSAQYRVCPDCGGTGLQQDADERENGEGERWIDRHENRRAS